jgi:predicted transcriptional regulator
MPPRKSITLTEAELRLMKLLWVRGESAVSDLVAAMPESEALAYTSVLTTVRIMMQRFFGNSRERLLLSLLGDEEIDAEELRRLKEAIAKASEDEAPTHRDETAMNEAPGVVAARKVAR